MGGGLEEEDGSPSMTLSVNKIKTTTDGHVRLFLAHRVSSLFSLLNELQWAAARITTRLQVFRVFTFFFTVSLISPPPSLSLSLSLSLSAYPSHHFFSLLKKKKKNIKGLFCTSSWRLLIQLLPLQHRSAGLSVTQINGSLVKRRSLWFSSEFCSVRSHDI